MLTLGLPGMAKLIQQQRTQTTAYELFQALQLARLEAVRRNDRATVRPLDGRLSLCSQRKWCIKLPQIRVLQ